MCLRLLAASGPGHSIPDRTPALNKSWGHLPRYRLLSAASGVRPRGSK